MLPCMTFTLSHIGLGVSTSSRCLFAATRSSFCLKRSAVRTLFTTSLCANESREMRFERPKMYQLDHVQKRLESTTPFMFRSRMDFTIYRRDVILQDRIFNIERIGLSSLQQHFGMLGLGGKLLFPHIELELLNISSFLDDGTVRVRWRVVYLNWFKALDPRNLKLENRLKKLRWYDGYSIFYVDGEGLVYKLTLQKLMPDDSEERSKTKKFAEKIGAIPSAATNCVGTESRTIRK